MAALPVIAMVMMAVGTAVSVMGQMQQGRNAKKAADYNAAIADRNAGIARQQAEQDAQAQQRQARLQQGAAVAAYGKSGVAIEGSPLDVLEQSASLAELDRQTILYRGELRAMGYADDANLSQFQGKAAMQQARSSAASTILMGGAKAAGMYGGGSSAGSPITPSSGGFG